jgi:hypothetical protein
MEFVKMTYKGFSFDVNPSSVKAEFSKTIAKKNIIFKSSKAQEICFENTKITASGKFTGENARQNSHTLMRIFKSKGSAYLFAPDIAPIKAYMSDLKISYNAGEQCVSYEVTFIEDCDDKSFLFDFGYTYALDGENLYDVSNRTDIAIEKLFEYNDYSDLFSVKEGDKIWLC